MLVLAQDPILKAKMQIFIKIREFFFVSLDQIVSVCIVVDQFIFTVISSARKYWLIYAIHGNI